MYPHTVDYSCGFIQSTKDGGMVTKGAVCSNGHTCTKYNTMRMKEEHRLTLYVQYNKRVRFINTSCILGINPSSYQPGNAVRAEVSGKYSQLAHMVIAPAIELTITGKSHRMGPATPDIYHYQLHGLQGLDDTWTCMETTSSSQHKKKQYLNYGQIGERLHTVLSYTTCFFPVH